MKTVDVVLRRAIIVSLLFVFAGISAQAQETLVLPSGLEYVYEQAFCDDTSIEHVIVPEGVIFIGRKAFANTGLQSIVLPESIRFIANDAFEGCDQLTVYADEGSYALDWAEVRGYIVEVQNTPTPDSTLTPSVTPIPSITHTPTYKPTSESILFRDIPWFKSKKYVKSRVDSINGIEKSWYLPMQDKARIDSWYHQWEYFYNDINIEDAGVILRYENARVAGYTADLELSFAYAIESGKVDYNADSAQFYKAVYTIEDIEDVEGAYNALVQKLSELYGSPEDKSYYNSLENMYSPRGSLWTAPDGSLAWLCIYYNSYKNNYDTLKIVYAAPDTDGFLTKLDLQIKKETAEDEAAQRDRQSDNYDGL